MKKERKKCEGNPVKGFGAFLVAVGILMGSVMLDVLHLGEPEEYLKWQILVLFFGVMSLVRAKLGEALMLFAVGIYFLLPHLNVVTSELFDKFYWPAVIIFAGLGFILAGLIKSVRKSKTINQ